MCNKDCGEGGFPGFFFFSRWKDEEEGVSTKVQRTALEQRLAAGLTLNRLVEPYTFSLGSIQTLHYLHRSQC